MSAYDDVADAYSHALDPEGEGLVDPVLAELIGEVAGQEVLSLACGRARMRGCLPVSAPRSPASTSRRGC